MPASGQAGFASSITESIRKLFDMAQWPPKHRVFEHISGHAFISENQELFTTLKELYRASIIPVILDLVPKNLRNFWRERLEGKLGNDAATKDTAFFILRDLGNVVAFCVVKKVDRQNLNGKFQSKGELFEVQSVAVSNNEKGKGYGRELVLHTQDYIRALFPGAKLFGYVPSRLEDRLKFYEGIRCEVSNRKEYFPTPHPPIIEGIFDSYTCLWYPFSAAPSPNAVILLYGEDPGARIGIKYDLDNITATFKRFENPARIYRMATMKDVWVDDESVSREPSDSSDSSSTLSSPSSDSVTDSMSACTQDAATSTGQNSWFQQFKSLLNKMVVHGGTRNVFIYYLGHGEGGRNSYPSFKCKGDSTVNMYDIYDLCEQLKFDLYVVGCDCCATSIPKLADDGARSETYKPQTYVPEPELHDPFNYKGKLIFSAADHGQLGQSLEGAGGFFSYYFMRRLTRNGWIKALEFAKTKLKDRPQAQEPVWPAHPEISELRVRASSGRGTDWEAEFNVQRF